MICDIIDVSNDTLITTYFDVGTVREARIKATIYALRHDQIIMCKVYEDTGKRFKIVSFSEIMKNPKHSLSASDYVDKRGDLVTSFTVDPDYIVGYKGEKK